MLILEFINPEKLPQTWGRQKVVQHVQINISAKAKSVHFSAKLIEAMNFIDPKFTQVQFVKAVENEVESWYLLPCQKGGWIVGKDKLKAKYDFSSTALVKYLTKLFAPEEANLRFIRIPVSAEPVLLKNEYKCLKIDIENIVREYEQGHIPQASQQAN